MMLMVVLLVTFSVATCTAQNCSHTPKLLTKLVAADGSEGSYFGTAVAISGRSIAVGAPYQDKNFGAVYLFLLNESTGCAAQVAKLTARFRAAVFFGYSVGITGKTIAIGAYNDGFNNVPSGAVYLFLLNDELTGATQQAVLVPSDRTRAMYFGFSLAVLDRLLVVGAYAAAAASVPNAGAVYLFMINNDGTSATETAKLVAANPIANAKMGQVVAVSGTSIVAGAPDASIQASSSGSVYIWPRSVEVSSSHGFNITGSDVSTNTGFGTSVAVYGSIVAVGTSASWNAVYIFQIARDGMSAQQILKLSGQGLAGSYGFGSSVALSNQLLLVGAPYWSGDKGQSSGTAYLFRYSSENAANLTLAARLGVWDGAEADYLGQTVAIDGETLVVASRSDNDANTAAGSAYVFSSGAMCVGQAFNQTAALIASNTTVTPFVVPQCPIYVAEPCRNATQPAFVQKMFVSEFSANAQLGSAVAVSGDHILLGARQADSGFGAAYLYRVDNGRESAWQVAKLTPVYRAKVSFGHAVAMDGPIIAIGAFSDGFNGVASGLVYVFLLHQDGNGASQRLELVAEDRASDDRFGWAVKVVGRHILVGASDSKNYNGSAYVFLINTEVTGATQLAMLRNTSFTRTSVIRPYFGDSVAFEGDILLISAPYDEFQVPLVGGGSRLFYGAVYLYRLEANGLSVAYQSRLLGDAADSRFGSSMALSGRYTAIGSSKTVYLFEVNFTRSSNATLITKLTPTDSSINLGGSLRSLAMDNGYILAGINGDFRGTGAGATLVFSINSNGTTAAQVATILATDGAKADNFGAAVAILGNVIAIGAYGDDDAALNAGSVYLFRGCWNTSLTTSTMATTTTIATTAAMTTVTTTTLTTMAMVTTTTTVTATTTLTTTTTTLPSATTVPATSPISTTRLPSTTSTTARPSSSLSFAFRVSNISSTSTIPVLADAAIEMFVDQAGTRREDIVNVTVTTSPASAGATGFVSVTFIVVFAQPAIKAEVEARNEEESLQFTDPGSGRTQPIIIIRELQTSNPSSSASGSFAVGAIIGILLALALVIILIVYAIRRNRMGRFAKSDILDEVYTAAAAGGGSAQPKVDIFVSFRYKEAFSAAKALKRKLEEQGDVKVFVCDQPNGEDLLQVVAGALSSCDLAVILGTKTYGQHTRSNFSSQKELQFIMDDKKPFFLVKMCDSFAEAATRMQLSLNINYTEWHGHHEEDFAERRTATPALPEGLVDSILEKLRQCRPSNRSVLDESSEASSRPLLHNFAARNLYDNQTHAAGHGPHYAETAVDSEDRPPEYEDPPTELDSKQIQVVGYLEVPGCDDDSAQA